MLWWYYFKSIPLWLPWHSSRKYKRNGRNSTIVTDVTTEYLCWKWKESSCIARYRCIYLSNNVIRWVPYFIFHLWPYPSTSGWMHNPYTELSIPIDISHNLIKLIIFINYNKIISFKYSIQAYILFCIWWRETYISLNGLWYSLVLISQAWNTFLVESCRK